MQQKKQKQNKTQYDRTKAYFYIFTYIYNYRFTCSQWVSIEMASGFYLTTGHKVLQLFVWSAHFARGSLKACQSW